MKINNTPPRISSVLHAIVVLSKSPLQTSMKTILQTTAAIAMIIFFGGCTMMPNVADMTPQQFKELHTSVSRDDFKKITTIKTSKIYFPENPSSIKEAYYFTATKKDGEGVSYQLTLYSWRLRSDGRAFWTNAADQNGSEFSLETRVAFDNSTTHTSIMEWSEAQLNREYLERIRKTGIAWRFYGKITSTATIESQIVEGFLMKVDEIFNE